jgi:hypothetical protein
VVHVGLMDYIGGILPAAAPFDNSDTVFILISDIYANLIPDLFEELIPLFSKIIESFSC